METSTRMYRLAALRALTLLTTVAAVATLMGSSATALLPVTAPPPIRMVPSVEYRPGPADPAPGRMADPSSAPTGSFLAAAEPEFSLVYALNVPAAARPAIEAAAARWAAVLRVTVPVVVEVDWALLPGDFLAGAAPIAAFSDFPGAPVPATFYPVALANQLRGTDIEPAEGDITITFGNRSDWHYALDGPVPSDAVSLTATALHELGHGLGVYDNFSVDSAGVGTAAAQGGLPLIYDRFVVDSAGVSLLDATAYPSPSTALGSRLSAGPLRWSGLAATAAAGGTRPVLYAPGAYESGSSISHLDEATYPPGDPDSLMTPLVSSSESLYSVGTIAPAMLRDEGWVLDSQVVTTTSTTSSTSTSSTSSTSTTVPGSTTTSSTSSTSSTVASTTSTTAVPTSTTVPPSTTTTAAAADPGGGGGDDEPSSTTTSAPASTTVTRITPVTILDPVPGVSTTVASGQLVRTGANSMGLTAIAVLCLAFGLALLGASNIPAITLALTGSRTLPAHRVGDRRLAVAALVAAAVVLVGSLGATPV